jgi:hypothetical protein
MLAQTTLQVETLRAIIEDFSDDGEGQLQPPVDQDHHHNVQVGFSIAASAEPRAPVQVLPNFVQESVSDDRLSAANYEQEIISALDSCVQEMATLDPQEKLVHCATVLQVCTPNSFTPFHVCYLLSALLIVFATELLGAGHIRHITTVR